MSSPQPRILVVDDDPIFRAIVAEALSPLTADVVEAGDGEEAFRLLSEAPAAVVVTDMNMPRRDGLELIGDVRRCWPQTAIIAVTAGSRAAAPELLLKTARLLGAGYSIQKPVGAAALLDLVRQALDGAPPPAQETSV